MGALTRLLTIMTVLSALQSGFAGEPCRGFKHLENGRTFFRYKGLYATFTCNPGFRIHGHHTSSCVSGQWVRQPPVCVASGCPSPGEIPHGHSDVNEDHSFAAFSCHDGYRLYGASLLYCKGRTWSGSKPVCKESDIMGSFKQKPVVSSSSNIEKNPRAPFSAGGDLKSHYDADSKGSYLLSASFPKSHLSERLLVKPKLAPLQRKPVKKQWLQKSAAFREPAPRVKSLETVEALTGAQQMLTTSSAPTPGPVLATITITPPVLTTASTELTEFKIDGQTPKRSGAGPTTADAPLLSNHEQEEVPSPTLSAARDPSSETHTLGLFVVVGSKTAQTQESDNISSTRNPVVVSTLMPHLPVKSVTSTSAYAQTTVDAQDNSQDGLTGIVVSSVQMTIDNLSDSLTDRLELPPKIKQAPLIFRLDDQPPALPIGENDTEDATNEDAKEEWKLPLSYTKFYKESDTIRPVAAISTDNQALQREQISSGVVHPKAPRPTPVLHPSPSVATPNSSTSSLPTDPGDDGFRGAGFSPGVARWDSQFLVGMVTEATHLELVQTVTEAADVTQASQHRLANEQSHTLSTSPLSANVQIAPDTEPGSPEGSMEAHTTFDPKHDHEESSLPDLDTVTESLLGSSSQRIQTLPVSSSASQRNGAYSLAFSSTGETPSLAPSSYPQELEAFSVEARPSELPIRKRRPVCPYPPLPAHGTFYFRTIEKPARLQYKHYIQYACYPGYTLANGDVYSYCQQNGTWSGITPACLEVTPCSLNNGGCSQLCSAGPHHQAVCQCRHGFMLLEDLRTCRDVNECVEESHQCQQACVNTLGSYRCSCRTGFQLNADGKTCMDVSECAESGQPACEWKCVNLSGSHHCICPRGFRRHTDGRRCMDINECNYSNGGCSHDCKNLRGGYKCVCPASHHISPTNRKKCLLRTE